MRHSFWQWVFEFFVVENDYGTQVLSGQLRRFDNDLLMDFERRSQVVVDHNGNGINDSCRRLHESVEAEHAELVLADFLLASKRMTADGAKALETILKDSRSAWTIGLVDDEVGLVRRVPEALKETVDKAIASPGHAGRRLAEAWSSAFGLNPDPDKAYLLAVQAVEDASVRLVTPKDKEPTLGKVINAIRDQKNWSLPMEKTNPHTAPGDVLLAAMRLLWVGHKRHGGHTYTPVTQAEAEVAVLTAVTLVQLFESGAVTQI
jgi:hypothetical protein